MKKKLFILGVSALLLCGCGKIPTLSNGDEAVVTMKDGKMISANDFYEEIKDAYGLQTLISMIDKYIYETEFSDKLSDAKTYSEAALKQFKSNYDSEDAALQTLQTYYGYQTFEAYQNAIYINYLQNEAITTYVENSITEDELKEYYENSVYPDMTISHILITSSATSSSTDSEKEKAEEEAKATAQKVIDQLNTAKKEGKNITDTFSDLAKEYSKDDSTKDNGGNLGSINIGSLSSSYDELISAASKLSDGEYSTEVIKTELGYHVILKTATGEKKSYDDSLSDMKEKIADNKLNADNSLMVDAVQYYREQYDLDIVDSEISSQYSKYMNNLINSYKNNSSSN